MGFRKGLIVSFFFLTLFVWRCSSYEPNNDPKKVEFKRIPFSPPVSMLDSTKGVAKELPSENDYLKSFKIGEITGRFSIISSSKYDSLMSINVTQRVYSNKFSEVVFEKDSCLFIKLKNEEVDTLCSFQNPSGYFEKHYPKKYWKEKGKLIMNFSNWEESNDYIVELSDGSIFNLAPNYTISPDENYIFMYTNYFFDPLYSNSISIAKVSKGKAEMILETDPFPYTVKYAKWTSSSTVLLNIEEVSEDGEPLGELRYILTLEKN